MNHLVDLLQTLDSLPPTQEAVLATVISVEGSAYRQPGARMLILADGQAVGMVSGGCLEKHLMQRAFWLTRDGSVIQTYHTATDDALADDSLETYDEQQGFGLGCQGTIQVLFERICRQDNTPLDDALADDSLETYDLETYDEQQGFGLGCQGTIQVLFERICRQDNTPLLTALTALKQHKKPQQLVTVIASASPVFAIGQHFDLARFTALVSDWQPVSRQAASRKSRFEIVHYQQDDQQISVLIETLMPPLQLLIFGAGQDCLPLVSMAHLQGWQVTVIDGRLDRVQRHFSHPQAAFRHLPLEHADRVQAWFDTPQHTAVVVMTHSLTQDKVWLSQVLGAQHPPFFIGQLGPRYRTEQLIGAIGRFDGDYSTTPDNLFYPVGLPLGGDTPEAVALSITAHIQQVYSRHVQSV